MFISPAFAQTAAPAAAAPDMMTMLLPIALVTVVFYFLVIRPQSKKMRAHQAMMADLKKGDAVITAGGAVAIITEVNDHSFMVKSCGCEEIILKSTILGTPEEMAGADAGKELIKAAKKLNGASATADKKPEKKPKATKKKAAAKK